MTARYFIRLGLAGLLSCAAMQAQAQERPTNGLIFTPRNQLDRIPDASLPFGGSLPTSADLSAQMPPPGDQGAINSCVAWAVSYALKTFQERQEENWSILTAGGQTNPNRVFSPAFVYNQINGGQNRPTHFTDAFNVLVRHGAAPRSAMPDDFDFVAQPTPAARAAAARYRIRDWQEVPLRDIVYTKAQLSEGRPVVIGMLVDENYPKFRGSQPLTNYGGSQRSGHAMLVVGYDDDRRAFKVLNSWGTQWGDGGYGWVSYDHYQRAVQNAFVLFDSRNGGGADPVTGPLLTDATLTPVTLAEQGSLQVSGVFHNEMLSPTVKAMRLRGAFSLPRGVTGRANIVVRFAYPNGTPLRAVYPNYSLPDGQSAAAVGELPLTGDAIQNLAWSVPVPYCAMGAPSGVVCVGIPWGRPIRTQLTATVTLFVNGQAVAHAQPFPFEVLQ